MAEPPTKRARLSSYTEDEKLWLKDGNIILVSAQPNRKGFKVHRSFLALNAEFFSDLDNFARPDASGAQELELTDSTEDLTHFLYSLYITGFVSAPPIGIPPLDCFTGISPRARLKCLSLAWLASSASRTSTSALGYAPTSSGIYASSTRVRPNDPIPS